MASRWSARCANNGSGPSVAAGSARTRAGRLLTGDAATRAERASLSLWPVPGGRSPSMSATAVAAAQLAINVASSAGPSCAASGLGDAARPATSPSRSPSSLIRRSPLDSCVSSDQALHAARPLGNFGDREWGISVIRSKARYLGEQYCSDCRSFCRRIGPGGTCPHCDEPVAINDLIVATA
jgi:hypothetical protein